MYTSRVCIAFFCFAKEENDGPFTPHPPPPPPL